MIGKKKAHVSVDEAALLLLRLTHLQDVQFFREASDVQFDETGNRKRKYRYGDEDEIELEQQERKRRQILNREFKQFAEKIAEAATASVSSQGIRVLHMFSYELYSPVILWKSISLSANSPSRVYPFARMSASSQLPNAWSTSLTLLSLS